LHPPALPSGQPSTCVAINLLALPANTDLRFSSALRSPGCLRIRLRLAPPLDPPASPSNQPPACAGCQPSSFAFQSASDLRRLQTFQLPSTKSPACAFDPASSLTFQRASRFAPAARLPAAFPLTSGLRLQSTVQPALELNLRLSPAVASLALLSSHPSTRVDDRPSCPAFELNLRLSPDLNPPAVPSTNHQLALAINRSAVPVINFRLPSNAASSSFAFQFTSGLRRLPTFQLRLWNSTSD